MILISSLRPVSDDLICVAKKGIYSDPLSQFDLKIRQRIACSLTVNEIFSTMSAEEFPLRPPASTTPLVSLAR